jgi:hypothetical protein
MDSHQQCWSLMQARNGTKGPNRFGHMGFSCRRLPGVVEALTGLWFARPPLQPDVIDYPPHRHHHLMDPRGRHACQQRVSLGCELQMRDECGVGWGLSQQSDRQYGRLSR